MCLSLLFLFWYTTTLFTNKLWKLCYEIFAILRCTKINIVCISLSISELQEHASSHCSLLWHGKGIVYQQIIKLLVSTLYTLPLDKVLWMYIFMSLELQEHACRTVIATGYIGMALVVQH